jgi:hypothetical protein
MIQTLGWILFNQVANFLKRADRDPNSTDEVHETQMGIGFVIIPYARLSGGYPDFCVDGPIISTVAVHAAIAYADASSRPLREAPDLLSGRAVTLSTKDT